MDLGGLVRAVTVAFNDGAKLVTRIRDDRADTDRALPEEPTRDLLDSLHLGPLLVKGQYDRDLKRFGEPFACGDGQAREQMKDVLISLQMALIVSLRGISMDDGDVDFESLQQTLDDCRTNAGVCLGQLSQRLSDTAKARAMMPERDMMRFPAAQTPAHPSLAYSSSRSTRSTRSSGRDLRTPPDSIYEDFASMDIGSTTGTIRPPTQERKRANSSASKRGYQPRRPNTPQSQAGSHSIPSITIPQAQYDDRKGGRLLRAPSHEVLTPPDEDSLNGFRNGYVGRNGSRDRDSVARGSGSNLSDTGYHSTSYSSRRHAVPSVASSRSNGSRSRQPYTSSKLGVSQAPERAPSRARFGGIPSDPVPGTPNGRSNLFDMSTLDDPTTSEEEDVLSLRRPSSHALGADEHELVGSALSESPAQSFIVNLPDVDGYHTGVSPIPETDGSDHDSMLESPQLLANDVYHPEENGDDFEDHAEDPRFDFDDSTPTMGSGEFGYATVYETSRIKPVEAMPRYNPPPRARHARQDSLSRLRESRQFAVRSASSNGRATPLRSPAQEQSVTVAAEPRVSHYRNRPAPVQQHAPEPQPARLEHVAYLHQDAQMPRHPTGLPPPPPFSDNRPSSRSSGKHKPPQAYKVFPTTSPIVRGAPLPPPSMALPPPPTRLWAEPPRPSSSPGPPATDLSPVYPTSPLRPTTSATAEQTPLSALPQGRAAPDTAEEPSQEVVKPPPKQPRMVKIVPLDMAMYGGLYTTPEPPKPKKPEAPPMPVTLPLVLPTEKHLQGFCKGAYRTFLGLNSKGFSVTGRPVGMMGTVYAWQCSKCNFQGPVTTVSVEGKRMGRKKEEKIFDPKVRISPVKGVDGQVGGVRYKWAFLAKCHVRLKKHVDWMGDTKPAAAGEVGSFGCIFCCAEGEARGWEGSAFNHMHANGDRGSVRSGSTGNSGKTTESNVGANTPVFGNLLSFLEHLEMHRIAAGAPGPEMLGRMKAVHGRAAVEGEEWEINFMPLQSATDA